MALTKEEIQIVFDVKSKEIEKALKDANKAIDNIGKTSTKASESVGTLGTALKAVVSVVAIKKVANVFVSLTKAGQEYENIQKNLVISIEAARKSTRGLVSDLDLMKSANRATALGLNYTEREFAKISEAAIKMSAAMGTDATQAVNDLVTGLGRQSVQILDNLGIIVKAEEAYAAYKREIGAVNRKLTSSEKRIAFQKAALDSLNEKVSQVSMNTDTMGGSLAKLSAQWDNLGVALGNFINKNAGVAKILNEVGYAFNFWVETLNSLAGGSVDQINEKINVAQDDLTMLIPDLQRGVITDPSKLPSAKRFAQAKEPIPASKVKKESEANRIKRMMGVLPGLSEAPVSAEEAKSAIEPLLPPVDTIGKMLDEQFEKGAKVFFELQKERADKEEVLREEAFMGKIAQAKERFAEIVPEGSAFLRSILPPEEFDRVAQQFDSLGYVGQQAFGMLGKVGMSSMQALGQGLFRAAMAGKNFGDVFRKVIADQIMQLGEYAAIQAIIETAKGIAALIFAPWEAQQHFASAAAYGAAAAAAGAAAVAISGGFPGETSTAAQPTAPAGYGSRIAGGGATASGSFGPSPISGQEGATVGGTGANITVNYNVNTVIPPDPQQSAVTIAGMINDARNQGYLN